MAQVCHPIHLGQQQEDQKFKASLNYIMSLRLTWAPADLSHKQRIVTIKLTFWIRFQVLILKPFKLPFSIGGGACATATSGCRRTVCRSQCSLPGTQAGLAVGASICGPELLI